MLVRSGSLEWLPEADANGGFLLLQGLVDSANFLYHVDVVGRKLANPYEVFDSGLSAATREEPTG